MPDFGAVIKGLLCAGMVILTGTFAILEYIMAFLEFIIVSSVGIIFFPLSLWEGSKFLSEKFVSAIIGFFVKLLFSTICIFLMLYGFYSLAAGYTAVHFSGTAADLAIVAFTSLLFFYICKSAPGLAQSLLTGTPSLSASGAISAVTGAVGAVAAAGGMAASAGGALAGGAAKAGFGLAGAGTQAAGAVQGAMAQGGNARAIAGALGNSLKTSASEGFKSAGSGLARSLLGGGKGGGEDGGGAVNSHNERQKFMAARNADGTQQSFKDYFAGRKDVGNDMGRYYSQGSMAKQAAEQEKREAEGKGEST